MPEYYPGWYDQNGNRVRQTEQDQTYNSPPVDPVDDTFRALQPLAADMQYVIGPGIEVPLWEGDKKPWQMPPPPPNIGLEPRWTTDTILINLWRQFPPAWFTSGSPGNPGRCLIIEREGSGKFSMDKNGVTGERIFECPYVFPDKSTYLDFCQKLLGWSFVNQDSTEIIIPPDVFSNELNWLLCQTLEVNGEQQSGYEGNQATKETRGVVPPIWPTIDQQVARGSIFPNFNSAARLFPRPAGGVTLGNGVTLDAAYMANLNNPWPVPLSPRISYSRMIVKAKYAPFDYAETVSLSGQSLTRPGNVFAYSSADDPHALAVFDDIGPSLNSRRVDDNLSVMFPMQEWSFNRHQIWEPNFSQLMRAIGKVNKYQFLNYPARTVLLLGAEGKKTYFANGTRIWDLTFKFQINPREHVKIMRKDPPYDGQWWYVKDRFGRFIFDLADFNMILRWS